jgi:hypothetical protein
MPNLDQLEIIDPAGRIRFYPLESSKGITNIGRHIDNDIVINRPGVAPFHAILDHRNKPYHLVVLAQRETTTLDNVPAPINIPTPLQNWAAVEIGGHQIIFLAGEEPAQPAVPPAAAEASNEGVVIAAAAATNLAAVVPAPTSAPAVAADPTAGLAVDFSTRALALDAGQTGTVDLTVINGSYKPLMFQVAVADLEPGWITVTPAQLEVAARQRATVSITVTLPRNGSARAGTMSAGVLVTTPDYPDWKYQGKLTLTINPFSDFLVSKLSPRAQSLYYSQPTAQTKFEITNRGNTDGVYRLTGEDERFACRYEFKLPEELIFQPRQAEIKLAPGESAKITLRVTPVNRHRAGWGDRRHFFTVSVAPQGGQQLPRSVLGEIREQPLVGNLALSLIAIALAALLILVARPSISTFTALPAQITAGQTVTFTWSASPFSSLRISPDIGAVPGPDGRMTITPVRDTVYTLIAENFLSWINTSWFRATRDVRVLVDPVMPSILFTTDHDSVSPGESVRLSWKVDNADDLVLAVNGTPEAIPAGQFNSGRSVTIQTETTFLLTARNKYTTADGVSAKIVVHAGGARATATPAPAGGTPASAQPVIDRFEVSPAEVTAGQQVTIYWSVTGVDKVLIDPLPGQFPASGNLVVSPQQTTAYVLTATNGTTPVKLVKQVIVDAAPGAPKIVSFTASPAEVQPGSAESKAVKLNWQVTGQSTDIQLSGPGLTPLVNLPAQGEQIVQVSATSTFTLTALNGSLSSVKTVDVKVSSPAPTLNGVSPTTGVAGSSSLLLTVTGSNFSSGSVVQWNGSARATTFVSGTQLQATLTGADLAGAGVGVVTVFTAAPGGGTSGPVNLTITNPAPAISALTPNAAAAGGSAFTLTITGTGFTIQTQVRLNGTQRTSTFISATQMTVEITASDLTTAGTMTVSVNNPVPGGGSDASVLTIGAGTPTVTPTVTPTPTPTLTPTPTATP